MTDQEWRADLAAALMGTDWLIDSATVTQRYPYAVAAVRHSVTGDTRIVQLPLNTLRTPATRKVDVLKQLAEGA